MRCNIVLEFEAEDGSLPIRFELLHLHQDTNLPKQGDVGLTLAEAKTIMQSTQQEFVVEQLNQYCASLRACVRCGVERKRHDSHCSEVCTVLARV